jgi:hypothetical protein
MNLAEWDFNLKWRAIMDILTFLSKFISWPFVTVIIVIVFKNQIIRLLQYIRTLKYKDLEINFAENVRLLEDEAIKSMPQKTKRDLIENDLMFKKINELIEVSPRIAIIESWRELEAASIIFLIRKGLKPIREFNIQEFPKILRKERVLSGDQIDIINKIKVLRDQSAYINKFKPDEIAARTLTHIILNYAEYLRDKTYFKTDLESNSTQSDNTRKLLER